MTVHLTFEQVKHLVNVSVSKDASIELLLQFAERAAEAAEQRQSKLHTSAQHIRDLLQLVPDGLEGVDLATCRAADAWVKEIGNE